MAPLQSSALLESSQGAWLRDPSLGHLPDDFTQRQQFKALSDYAAKAEPLAAGNAAAAARLEQVKPLLDAAAKGVVLAGTADQLRAAELAALDIRHSSADTCPPSADQSLEWVQTGIKRLTAPGLVVDGTYGPKTRRAISDFQARYGLTADGSLGNRTRAKLRELLCGP